MATEVLRLTSQIVISHASMTELTPQELVEEIKEVYNVLAAMESGAAIPEGEAAEKAAEEAVAADRTRLARDLHDAVSQTLFSASVISETLPRLWKRNPARVERGLEQLHQLTRGALAEMHALLVELRPTALVETDLGDLLHQLAEATMSRTRIAASVAIEGKPALPPEVQIALYRIAQEALNNVLKHAHARQVQVRLSFGDALTCLEVEDDGVGFDPAGSFPGHLGLQSMRERATDLDGTLEIDSALGCGTRVRIRVPLNGQHL